MRALRGQNLFPIFCRSWIESEIRRIRGSVHSHYILNIKTTVISTQNESKIQILACAANPNGISVPTINNDDKNSKIGGVHQK